MLLGVCLAFGDDTVIKFTAQKFSCHESLEDTSSSGASNLVFRKEHELLLDYLIMYNEKYSAYCSLYSAYYSMYSVGKILSIFISLQYQAVGD
ncbi:hypothetical protein CEXT_709521 [Caerostris extrusa]|uniref:Uncharacterized protein n=1 Tax=Caerostris extrusa TaxID=172846 RepID=A0AAV4UKG5_CAEEX|nr:hypothetical protein CEXT_709521 [Caerostris extrusa]